jgi:hypothetical protein
MSDFMCGECFSAFSSPADIGAGTSGFLCSVWCSPPPVSLYHTHISWFVWFQEPVLLLVVVLVLSALM